MNLKNKFRNIFDNHSSNVLLIDRETGLQFTYRDFEVRVRQVTDYLRTLDLRRSASIAIVSENRLELPFLLMASWTLGIKVVPINFELGSLQVSDILKSNDVSVVFTSELAKKVVGGIGALSDCGAQVHIFDFEGSEHFLWNKWCEFGGESVAFEMLSDDFEFLRIYTSGSTAAPKGVDVLMGRLFANEQLFCKTLKIDCSNRFYNILPMSYLGGIHNLFLLPLSVGASFVLDKPLGPQNIFGFWETVDDKKINTLWFSPTMMTMLSALRDDDDILEITSKIKIALVGMAPLSKAEQIRFESRFHLKLLENYALSETAFLTTQMPDKDYAEGCKGEVLESVLIDIIDGRGDRLSDGEVGEVRVNTPYLMQGYVNAPQEDLDAITDQGFRTGDLGFLNDNNLFITGRKKDLIIRGGLNISPPLVEAEIAKLDYIAAVSVVGVPHDFYGEEVAAALVVTDKNIGLEKIEKDLDKILPNFQKPKELLLLDNFPLGSTGKVDKKAVRCLFQKGGGYD